MQEKHIHRYTYHCTLEKVPWNRISLVILHTCASLPDPAICGNATDSVTMNFPQSLTYFFLDSFSMCLSRLRVMAVPCVWKVYVCFYLDYHFPKPSKLPLALRTIYTAIFTWHVLFLLLWVECTCGVCSLASVCYFCLGNIVVVVVVGLLTLLALSLRLLIFHSLNNTHVHIIVYDSYIIIFCIVWGIKINFSGNEQRRIKHIKNIFTLINVLICSMNF